MRVEGVDVRVCGWLLTKFLVIMRRRRECSESGYFIATSRLGVGMEGQRWGWMWMGDEGKRSPTRHPHACPYLEVVDMGASSEPPFLRKSSIT